MARRILTADLRAAIRRRSRDSAAQDFAAFEQRWLRPDNVQDLHRVRPAAERGRAAARAALRKWAAAGRAEGRRRPSPRSPPRPASAKILLINRPGSPQSSIVGAQLLPIDPRADIVPFDTANDVLGGTFLSRLNMDLREDKGWSYGVNGDESVLEHAVSTSSRRPSRRTGPAIRWPSSTGRSAIS